MKILQRTFYSFLTVIDAQPCPTLCDPKDWSPPSSSVHGILQARILEWVAVPFSRRFSQPRDQTQVSLMAGIFFIVWVTREALSWQYTDLNAWRAKQLSPLKIPRKKGAQLFSSPDICSHMNNDTILWGRDHMDNLILVMKTQTSQMIQKKGECLSQKIWIKISLKLQDHHTSV